MMFDRGFSPRWIYIIKTLLDNGSVGVILNDENSDFFLTGRGVRQGDPISPILFNLVADLFTKRLIKAAMHNYITGLMHEIIPTVIISMQYADDTLLFLKINLENVVNLKWILSCLNKCLG
jgi:hypothetical protein